MSFGYHPEIDPLLRPAIQPKSIGMLLLSGMKIVKKFPPDNHNRFKGPNGQPFHPVDLPAEFVSIDLQAVSGQVAVHDPKVYIPDPPQPHGPPWAPQFLRHVGVGPAPSHAAYQQLREDVDHVREDVDHLREDVGWLNHVMGCVAEELQERRQRDGLLSRPYISAAAWH
ncbi:hypothetical protein Hanom_Chr11g01064141 [Helianthus anomalus]